MYARLELKCAIHCTLDSVVLFRELPGESACLTFVAQGGGQALSLSPANC